MDDTIDKPCFRERCRREMTRDVVFLFQSRRWNLIGIPDGHEHDGEGVVDLSKPGEYLSYESLADMTSGDYDVPCAIEQWETERVFLSREEGEAYGTRYQYRYRDGWRVYGVSAAGELVELIKSS